MIINYRNGCNVCLQEVFLLVILLFTIDKLTLRTPLVWVS